MSLITRCPACTTMFKLVPDQLRISDGWVRCGQCDEVFDANVHLQSGSFLSPGVSPTPSPLPPTLQKPAQPLQAHVDESVEITRLPTDLPPQERELKDGLETRDPFLERSPVELSQFSTNTLVGLEKRILSDAAYELGAPEPAFMQPVGSVVVASTPGVQRSLSAVCFALVLLFFAQLVVQQRERLAATLPELRPGLSVACAFIGCEVTPLREIESVVIESSSFARVRSHFYHVNVTLKNVAQVDLAVPALELTLTDLQDRVLVRRVFPSEHVVPNHQTISSGGDAIVSLPIELTLPEGSEQISGYRLLAFYP